MATNARAQANGFATPASTDLIRTGDDAIAQNARATVDLHDRALAIIDNWTVAATTLDYGQPATATITGELAGKVINLGIPKGMTEEAAGQFLLSAQAAEASAASAEADAAQSLSLAQQAQFDAQNAASLVGAPPSDVVSAVVSRMLVDAKDHGVTGDGTTNDATALNALIASVSTAGGGTIVLPRGVYLTTAITGASSVTVRGASREGTILRKTASNTTWIKTGASAGFVLERMTIDGADLVTSYGLEFSTGSSDCAVRDCTLTNFTQAVETRTGAVRPVVEGNLITGFGTGVRLNQDPLAPVVRGNVFTDWTESAIYALGSASYATTDALIEDNVIQRHRPGSAGIRQPIRFSGVDTLHHQRPRIRGNTVTGPGTNHQDTLDPGSADLISLHRCTGFEVSGNTVRAGGDVGITIAQGCRDGRVFGNVSEDNDTVGICLGSADSAVHVARITVTGNTFRNNAQDHPDTGGTAITRAVDRAKSGVLAVRADDCVIDNNVIVFDAGHPTAIRNAIAWRECVNVHVGAVGAGNKAAGHTAAYYSETPASTGMTTVTASTLTAP